MAKRFKSLESLVSYIKNNCHQEALEEIGKDSVDMMKEIVQEEVYDKYTPVSYDRYDEVYNSVRVTEIDNKHVKIELEDNGHWASINGGHFYAPYGLESGKTWGEGSTPDDPKYRPKTSIQERSVEEIEKDAPLTYKRVMNNKGFRVK